jgi:hypothetical protein
MDATVRKYQSGREVLETFIPGYVAPVNVIDEGPFEPPKAKSASEVSDSLLSSLRTELDRLDLQRQHA